MLKGISGGQKKRLTTGLILLSFGYEKADKFMHTNVVDVFGRRIASGSS